MKKLTVLLAAEILLGATFADDSYPWIEKFHDVDVVAAAQNRTNWQTNGVDWTKGELQGSASIVYVPVVLNADGGWGHKMYCHFVRVDTHDRNVRFTGTDRCADWCAKRMPSPHEDVWRYTLKEPTADFIARFRGSKADGGRGRNMRLAYNATAWTPSGSQYWANICGPFYADGIRISEYSAGGLVSYPGCGVLVVWKDGTAEIVDKLKAEDEKRIWACLPGFERKLVTRGVNVVEGDGYSFCTAIRPRTAVGMSQDKRYLYVIVVDGDHPTEWCDGCDLSTLARMFLLVGAYEAFNCDGGGSSNMVTWDDVQDKPRMMGRPSDGNSFRPSTQRKGGSHMGVYLASIVAKIGTFVYDEWGFLLQDVADGEVPDGVRDIDVLADLTLAKPADLPAGYALNLADGVTLTVAAGVHAPVRGGSGTATVVTADAGFMLQGALGASLNVRCAAATQAGATFGSSSLTLAETRAQLRRILCADDASLVPVASGPDGAVVLSWGTVALGSTTATIRANDTKADVSVEVLSGGPSTGEAVAIRLTLTDNRNDTSSVYTKDLEGAGTYTFVVRGADFGYTYAVELLDGAGSALEKMRTEDEIVFARLDDWFAADVAEGSETGGAWTAFGELEKVFEAAESGKGGFVRVIAAVPAFRTCDEIALAKMLKKALAEGVPHAAMTVGCGANGCRWYGLVDENGSPAWRALAGNPALADESACVMMQEVSFGPDRTPCVRYFAGDADGAVLELLKDASGKSSFAGASKSASVEGIVRFLGEGRVAALRAVSADKGGVPGVVIFLK